MSESVKPIREHHRVTSARTLTCFSQVLGLPGDLQQQASINYKTLTFRVEL